MTGTAQSSIGSDAEGPRTKEFTVHLETAGLDRRGAAVECWPREDQRAVTELGESCGAGDAALQIEHSGLYFDG